MTESLKDPHHVIQTLANGPIFMSKVANMNILTFTQIIGRAEETLVGGASNPSLDHIVVARIAMTDLVLKELTATLSNAHMVHAAVAGTA